jgi:BlaI family transcriptional regulator, penicillinase repressor
MVRRKVSRPTDGELAILRVLWDRGPSTVRQVNRAMSAEKATGYTTTLKLLQIMIEKGLVLRDEAQWPHVYEPAFTEEKTQRQMVRDLLDKAFAGSTGKLVLRALAAKKVSAQERAEIRKLLDELEGEKA